MSRLPVLSSDTVFRALKRAGFDYAPRRSKGRQVALYRVDEVGRRLLVILPKRSVLPVGTLLCILQQANIQKERFVLLVSEAAPVS
ncbi:type II toxin-antitoxin system HicA family toxin [Methanofollis ethanolicus]|uniref:type II toxin-antitoxin system HicA family toxin n=1 Tax=Methanofollis ethanolicus TaxID=488124 RepID=UPI0008336158|nr:type II toxin-antitoxin system HicA family toxin [Methanofollis ethanolicus]